MHLIFELAKCSELRMKNQSHPHNFKGTFQRVRYSIEGANWRDLRITSPQTFPTFGEILIFDLMKKGNYDYNTQREHLVIREYGRHVQGMVEYAASVEDKEKRARMVAGIIELMGQMNPGLRNVEEFRHKLWDHIFIISGGKLNVESPYPKPRSEKAGKNTGHMGYPRQSIRFKHYGKNVERLIEKAIDMEDEAKKKDFAECIGNYMKLVHRNWNKENANDEVIKQDIGSLSGGKLQLEEGSNLDSLTRATPQRRDKDNFRANGRRDRGHHRGNRDRNRGDGQGRHGGQGRFRDNRNRRNRDNRDRS